MSRTFVLPDLGEGLVEAEIRNLLVKEGDLVKEDAPLLEVETDKAQVEIPSPFSGRVEKIHVQPGQTVKVGQPLVSFGDAAGAAAASAPAAPRQSTPATPVAEAKAPTAPPSVAASPPSLTTAAKADGGPVAATPSTRRLHYSAVPFATQTAEGAQKPLIVLQVEARLATTDLGGILGIEGLDVIFIGPYDLSTSLGLAGQFDHPRVREAISEIVNRAAERNVAVGIWVPDAESAHFWVERGVRFVTVSNNELMFFGAASSLRHAVQG